MLRRRIIVSVLLSLFLLVFQIHDSHAKESPSHEKWKSQQLLVQFNEAVWQWPETASQKAVPFSELTQVYPEIVKIFQRYGVSTVTLQFDEKAFLKRPHPRYSNERWEALVSRLPLLRHRYLLELGDPRSLDDLKAILDRSPLVKKTSYNYYLTADTEPNDERYDEQWAPPFIGLDEAWDILTEAHINDAWTWSHSINDSDIVVGIVDMAFQGDHEDLAGNVIVVENTPEVLADPELMDLCDNHGTHVAGIAGAMGNNDIGVAGVFWKGSLVLSGDGTYVQESGDCATTADDSEYAITKAMSWESDIINHSATLVGWVVDYAEFLEATVLFVNSAGNSNKDQDTYTQPIEFAALDNSLLVASASSSGAKASYSNYGNQTVHLAAPGDSILSTVPTDTYAKSSGTSMAAPMVTGVAALAWARCPNLAVQDLRELILDTVTQSSQWTGLTITGGILNADQALTRAAEICNQYDNDGDGRSENAGDCDDTDATVKPGGTETCDGKDNNCDGSIDPGCDTDGDGYSPENGDCDDADPNRHPGATETCGDGIDQDCDGADKSCGSDPDGDGLTNDEEAAAGTNPQDPDSDDDGLNDYKEVKVYGTNPLSVDSFVYCSSYSDPNMFFEDPKDLANIALKKPTSSLVHEDPTYSTNLGYTADKLVDGSVSTLAYPAATELWYDIDLQGNYDALLEIKLYWGQFGDHSDSHYVDSWQLIGITDQGDKVTLAHKEGMGNCEASEVKLNEAVKTISFSHLQIHAWSSGDWIGIYELAAYRNQVDSDDDGLNDYEESDIYGTDPNKKDTDGDGLLDGEEVDIYSTNPTLSDTDGDGFPDSVKSASLVLNTYATDPTKDTTPTYSGTAEIIPLSTSAGVKVNGVEYSVNGIGEPNQASTASDGDFDSLVEAYTFTTPELPEGTYTVETRLVGVAGSIYFYIPHATDQITIMSNRAPTANDDTATTTINTLIGIDVRLNDTDPNGDYLTIVKVSDPAHGTASIPGDHVAYTPDNNFIGTDTFTYTVDDGDGLQDTATVTVTVINKDSDGDGLPDSDEITYGSDPTLWDTDGNGLPDSVKSASLILNPYSPDPTTSLDLEYSGSAELILLDEDVTGVQIQNVEYSISNTDISWKSATASDGQFDSLKEDYYFSTSKLEPGTYSVQVRLVGSAGSTYFYTAHTSDDITIFVDDDGDGVSHEEDCNDTDELIHPGAEDICGNGVDEDCSGSDQLCPNDIDNDGDGYTENQGDCNDTNWEVNPGMEEIEGDDIDNDCDGVVDESASCISAEAQSEFEKEFRTLVSTSPLIPRPLANSLLALVKRNALSVGQVLDKNPNALKDGLSLLAEWKTALANSGEAPISTLLRRSAAWNTIFSGTSQTNTAFAELRKLEVFLNREAADNPTLAVFLQHLEKFLTQGTREQGVYLFR